MDESITFTETITKGKRFPLLTGQWQLSTLTEP